MSGYFKPSNLSLSLSLPSNLQLPLSSFLIFSWWPCCCLHWRDRRNWKWPTHLLIMNSPKLLSPFPPVLTEGLFLLFSKASFLQTHAHMHKTAFFVWLILLKHLYLTQISSTSHCTGTNICWMLSIEFFAHSEGTDYDFPSGCTQCFEWCQMCSKWTINICWINFPDFSGVSLVCPLNQ